MPRRWSYAREMGLAWLNPSEAHKVCVGGRGSGVWLHRGHVKLPLPDIEPALPAVGERILNRFPDYPGSPYNTFFENDLPIWLCQFLVVARRI